MKCNKCGNYVDNDNISFCPTCGSLLQSNVEVLGLSNTYGKTL